MSEQLRQLISRKVQTSLEEQGTDFDNTLVDNMVNCYLEHIDHQNLEEITSPQINYFYGRYAR